MLLLALDTSTPSVTVAVADVSDGCTVLAERSEVATNRHGELLAPLVGDVLRTAGVARSGLGAVAVGLGPGPFTGLRVGIVTAAALGDALAIPVYGVCSLDALACRHRGDGPYAVATDARRRQLYWAAYDAQGTRLDGPHVDVPAAVVTALRADGVTRIAGAGALLHRAQLDGLTVTDASAYPRAADVAALAAPRARAGEPGDLLEPLYLRRPDAVPPGPRKQVTPA